MVEAAASFMAVTAQKSNSSIKKVETNVIEYLFFKTKSVHCTLKSFFGNKCLKKA